MLTHTFAAHAILLAPQQNASKMKRREIIKKKVNFAMGCAAARISKHP